MKLAASGRSVAATLVLLLWPSIAGAQDFLFSASVELAAGNIQSFTTTLTLQNTIDPEEASEPRAKKAGGGSPSSGKSADSASPSGTKPTASGSASSSKPSKSRPIQTAYVASPDVSKRVQAAFLAWAKSVSSTDAEQLDQAMLKHDFVKIYDGIVGDFGLASRDAGDAYTAYWILNWMMANRAPDPSRSAVAAVRSQVRQSLAKSATFPRLSDAERQEMAEVYIYNFVVQHGAYFGAVRRGDTGLARRLSDAAQARFSNERSIDLRGLNLTGRGFRKKG